MNDLKLFALEYISFQDNLKDKEKIILGKFVLEATDSQINYLLSKGEMIKKEDSRLQEYNVGGVSGANIIQSGDFLNITLGSKALAVIGGMGGIIAAATLASWSYKIYKNFISKAGRKCRDYPGGKSRSKCFATVKLMGLQKQIEALRKGKMACSKSKDPKKCSSKIREKEGRIKLKFNKTKSEVSSIDAAIKQKIGN